MAEIIISKFGGGISDDIREPSGDKFSITKHFDIFSNPNRLTPYRSTETGTTIVADTTALKQYDVRTFQLGSDVALYGLGIQPGSTTKTKVLKNTDPTLSVWTTPATAESGITSSASFRNCFIEWQGAFWMIGGGAGNAVSKWVIGGTFTDAVSALGATVTHVAQGVIAPDNNLYIFYNNKVVRVNSSSAVTDAVLTLPSDGRITNACVFGKYLAIAWASGTTLTAGGRSKLFIWDLVSADVTESIDFGEGQLMIVGNVEGKVVGISDYFMSSSYGIKNGSVVVRMYAGGTPSIIKEIKATQDVSLGGFIRDVVIKANKLYFVATIPFNYSTGTASTYHLGIWAFGRKNENSNFALTLDYVDESIDTSNFKINSFGNVGNYWWINHSADGSVSKTDDQASYTFTSIYESQKFTCGDATTLKQLDSAFLSCVPLPTAGQVVVKYKKDEESSFTTIFTDGTDNMVGHESVNIDSTTNPLPQFKEIQFRIESTGGAEITSFGFTYTPQKGLK